jgi:hypothetical protein
VLDDSVRHKLLTKFRCDLGIRRHEDQACGWTIKSMNGVEELTKLIAKGLKQDRFVFKGVRAAVNHQSSRFEHGN